VYACLRACMRACAFWCMRVCMCASMRACVRVCMHAFEHVCVRACAIMGIMPDYIRCIYSRKVWMCLFTCQINCALIPPVEICRGQVIRIIAAKIYYFFLWCAGCTPASLLCSCWRARQSSSWDTNLFLDHDPFILHLLSLVMLKVQSRGNWDVQLARKSHHALHQRAWPRYRDCNVLVFLLLPHLILHHGAHLLLPSFQYFEESCPVWVGWIAWSVPRPMWLRLIFKEVVHRYMCLTLPPAKI